MNWTGKLIGALLGFILSRRPLGALIGLILGHFYDLQRSGGLAGPRADPAIVRSTFFRTAFSIMGYVAKSDGRVSEQDIAAARRIFRQFNLGDADTRAAMECFTRGKDSGFDARAALAELLHVCRGRGDLLRMFLEIQMRAALMGDGMHGATHATLVRVAQALGISAIEFAHLETVLRLQGYGAAHGDGRYGRGPPPGASAAGRDALAEAYEVLDVPRTASDAEVKRSYRRLMSRNHPDKLVARGLPESMLEVAKQKTQAIQAAYERIRESRGMR
ncbi:MAG: co-chaperone DjlA [Gammaproteobacteria bacterium]|nr:co-chaperone DjlA [Gammaproteobacteria bacterium]